MAKVNFGTTINDARGKIAGVVASKNKSGAYFRTKVTPANPRTTYQQAVRATFAQLSQDWSNTLTDSERGAWTTFAATFTVNDVFGNAIHLNGLNMYVRINAALTNAGLAILSLPPASPATTPIATQGPLVATASTHVLSIDQTNADDASGNLLYIFATGNTPPGRSPTPSGFRFIGTFAQQALAGATLDFGTLWVNKFGAALAGTAVNILVSTIAPTVGIPTVATPYGAKWA
jgi:hypothetical protein